MKVRLSDSTLQEVSKNNEKCIACNKCTKECPMINEINLKPKYILEEINREKKIDSKIPFSCTFCNRCANVCPVNIDLSSMYSIIRKDIFKNNEKVVDTFGYSTIKFHQRNSYSNMFTGDNIASRSSKKVFFPGCSLSGYNSNIVNKTYKYLCDKIEDLGILVTCCGKPSIDIGDIESFNKKFKSVIDKLKENNIEKIIVACSNCFNVLKEYTDIKVVSLWEVLSEIGIPNNVKGIYVYSNMSVALHDPCPTREEDSIHESIRYILNNIGLEYKEFDKNKRETQCCGAGGMMMCTNRNVALKQIDKRANQVDSDCVVSYCESCVNSMITGGKKGLHILDLLFNEDVIKGVKNTQKNRGVLSHWIERRHSAKSARK